MSIYKPSTVAEWGAYADRCRQVREDIRAFGPRLAEFGEVQRSLFNSEVISTFGSPTVSYPTHRLISALMFGATERQHPIHRGLWARAAAAWLAAKTEFQRTTLVVPAGAP